MSRFSQGIENLVYQSKETSRSGNSRAKDSQPGTIDKGHVTKIFILRFLRAHFPISSPSFASTLFIMFGAIRRFGVSQVLRASAPRTLSARWASQSLKWQAQPIQSPALVRSFQTSFPALRAAAAEAEAALGESAETELITEFADLKTKGLIDPTIVRNITHPDRMGLTTMTEVQSQTINQMLQGDDMYVDTIFAI